MNLTCLAPLRNVRQRLTVLVPAIASVITASNIDAASVSVSVNSGWNPQVQGPVHAVTVQPDGKVVIGGEFWQVNGQQKSNLARLLTDGSLDQHFASAQPRGPVYAVALHEGSVFAGGRFGEVDGITHDGIARYGASGEIDHSFTAGVGGVIRGITADSSGVTVGGSFTQVADNSQYYVARFDSDGAASTDYSPALQYSLAIEAGVNCLARDASGKTVVAGIFNTAAGYSTLARLHPDGSLDSTFEAEGTCLYVFAVKLQSDGKLLIAGMKSAQGDGFVRRLNANGSIDHSFVEVAVNGAVNDLVLLSSGKIVVGGQFSEIGGTPKAGLARLNADGSVDATFTANVSGSQSTVNALALAPDGCLVAGGWFTAINDTAVSNLALLKADDQMTVQTTNSNRGNFKSHLKGLAGKRYTVQSSTDLQNWNTFGTVTADAEGSIEVFEDQIHTSHKFFRAKLVD